MWTKKDQSKFQTILDGNWLYFRLVRDVNEKLFGFDCFVKLPIITLTHYSTRHECVFQSMETHHRTTPPYTSTLTISHQGSLCLWKLSAFDEVSWQLSYFCKCVARLGIIWTPRYSCTKCWIVPILPLLLTKSIKSLNSTLNSSTPFLLCWTIDENNWGGIL